MKKYINIIFTLFILLSSTMIFSQEQYFWRYNKKIDLKIDLSSEIIFEDKNNVLDIPKSSNIKEVASHKDTLNGNYKVILYNDHNSIKISDNKNILSRSYGLIDINGEIMWLSHYSLIKFIDGYTYKDVAKIAEKYNAKYIQDEFGVARFFIPNINNTLNFSNDIFENKYAEWSQPDFMISMHRNSWTEQYYLNNPNTSSNGYNKDINIMKAWDITKGCEGIIVAVIDDGVEEHPDLCDNYGNSRVLQGYTPSQVTINGRPGPGDKHGQACAGIIAASHSANVKGIAPHVKILPIKVRFGNGIPSSEFANAIKWAYQNKADIISNSWGNTLDDQIILDAVIEAQNNGRVINNQKKGCVVVFSSGNDSKNIISNYKREAVTISAINRNDQHAIYALTNERYGNIGVGLDLVAYGGDSYSNGGDIYTIDRVGINGYNTNGNYCNNFGGTSAACPQVSGVAALILSINPNLSRLEVQNCLYNSAIDLGINGYDISFGHGKVNAFGAVLLAIESLGHNLHFSEGYLNYNKISSNERIIFNEKPNPSISAGMYFCDIYKAETTIPYIPNFIWYRGKGLSYWNPNSGHHYINITYNRTSVSITTYFYYIKSTTGGQTINQWAPEDPNYASSRKYIIPPIEHITYNSTIESNQNVELYASNSIKLTTGTNIKAGAKFKALAISPQTLDLQCLPNLNQRIVLLDENNMNESEHENILEEPLNIKVTIYPNPNKGNFSIDFSEILERNAYLEIYNVNGQIISKIPIHSNNQNIIFTDKPGIYFLKLFNGGNLYNEKIILE